MEKWSREKAWEWYNQHTWLRGCNYLQSDCVNFIEQWQELNCEEKLATARDEADDIVRTAHQTAQRRSDAIVAEATSQASHIKQRAENEIAQEKKQMLSDVRSEISDIAVEIASRIVGREIRKEDHDSFVDDFIRNVGEQQ